MLIHLISDLMKNKELNAQFQTDPVSVFKKYQIEAKNQLKKEGIEGISEAITEEIKNFFSHETPIYGWPGGIMEISSIEPTQRSVGEAIGEVIIHGQSFNDIENEKEVSIVLISGAMKQYIAKDFQILSEEKIAASFPYSIPAGTYVLAIIKEESVLAKLPNALTVA